jgi:hypothetical protein
VKPPAHHRHPRTAAALAAALITLPACTIGGERSEADRLRNELRDTRAALEQTRRQRTELLAKVAELSANLDAAEGADAAAVVAALPRAAALDIDPFSELVDRDKQPGFEAVDVYILPRDGRDRFVQVAGTLRVTITRQPDNINDDPATLATVILEPEDLREAYRKTLFSTHYAVQLPLQPPVPRTDNPTNFRPLTINARLDDAITGLTHTASKQLTQ